MKVVEIFINSFFGKVKILSNSIDIEKNAYVVLETDKGIFVGQAISFYDSDVSYDKQYKIIRVATKNDMTQSNKNNCDAEIALIEIKKLVSKLNLEMNIVDSAFSLDRKRLYFSFVAETRVDFRELAKRLAQKYHTRIELRQIGVRDKAKKVGGIGPCGLLLCCNRFLNDFNSVSINMAKNQLLALNPNKINGSCGRLMCCLNYENEMYKEARKNMPKLGNIIETKDGKGKVVDIDVFRKNCKIELPNKNVVELKVGEIDGKVR